MPSLEWIGKSVIYSHHLRVPFRTLKIDKNKSLPLKSKTGRKAPNLEDNLIIHGDNLHALKALLPRYSGKIKCIYIDPPYNTGNEGWKYSDNVNSPVIKEWLKQNGIGTDDLERHDKWLCMMWPRIQLLKELLANDGVIFVSIDDNEQHHLRMIMDEIFGEENFIANFSWQSKYTLSNDASKVSYQHENILFYAKKVESFKIGLLPRTAEMDQAYKNPDNDLRGKWKATPLHAKSGKESDKYSLTFSNGVTWKCPKGRYPRYTKVKLLELYKEGKLHFGKTGKSVPNRKTYLSEVKTGKTVGSYWSYKEVGSTHSATEELATIFEKGKFSNPKGTTLLKRIIQIANVPANGIILDSFAGSGTTAHAVLDLNKEDGGDRKFILVECENYADQITAERVRRVIKELSKKSIKRKAMPDISSATKELLSEKRSEALCPPPTRGFTYCSLGDEISTTNMLKGRLPDYKQLAEYVFYTATGKSLTMPAKTNPAWFIGETKNYNFHLVYKPDVAFLTSKESALHSDLVETIGQFNKKSKKTSLVFAPASYITQKKLFKEYGIQFCQLPYAIHKIISL